MESIKAFVMTFIVAFFCFSLMLMATLLWIQPYSRPQSEPVQSNIFLPKEEDELNILLIHKDQTVKSFSCIFLSPHKGKVIVKTFPQTSVINGENLADLWEASTEDLKKLLSSQLKTNFDREILISDRDFIALIDMLGGISIKTEERLYFDENGIDMILEAGLQPMDGELLLFYLNQSKTGADYGRKNSAILISYLEKLLPHLDQENFLELLDHMESDLTVSDYDSLSNSLIFMEKFAVEPVVELYSGS